jgi:hypothetical protein
LVRASPRQTPWQVRRLPDGSTVTLEGFTRGQPHRFRTGGWKGQFFGSLLPQQAEAATGLHTLTLPLVDPQVPVAWLSWRPASRASTASPASYHWTVFDADGCETQADGWVRSYVLLGSSIDLTPMSLELRAYPRHGSPCGLRLYEDQVNAAPRRVAEFRLPPFEAPVQFQQHVHIRMPQRVARNGDLAFELRRFVTGCDLFSALTPPAFDDPTRRSTYLEIAATRQGRPTEEWMPVSFRVEGSVGNRFDAGAYGNPKRQGNVTQLSLPQNLFAKEGPWWVSVEVARTPHAHFAPNELIVLRKVPVPTRAGKSQFITGEVAPVSGIVNGVPLACRGLRWSSLGPPYAEAVVDLRIDRLPGYRATLVKATDDSGRDVPLPEGESRINEFSQLSTPMVQFDLPLLIRKPMKTVDLTFAVQRTRSVTFQATPTQPAGPAPQGYQPVTER